MKWKKVYKLYKYESVRDIFSSFVKYFSKLKQESSGFPAYCCDQNGNLKNELIDKFISDYLDHEGTCLDRFEMQEIRVGLHNIVKLILNALWGKFAQNEDRVEIFYVKTYEELSTLLENPIYENIHFNYLYHKVIRVAARKKASHIAYESNTNVIIACFVTCFARLRLYNVLISLPQDSVLYFDMDSIIYYSENEEELIKCRLIVGQLKN